MAGIKEPPEEPSKEMRLTDLREGPHDGEDLYGMDYPHPIARLQPWEAGDQG